VAQLQSNSEDEPDFGGFQAFVGEKKEYEGEWVTTVVNSYYAGRVLEISSEPALGGGENHFKRIDVPAALKFLSRSRGEDDIYRLYPGAKRASVASVYYGTLAWNLFAAHHNNPQSLTAAKPEAVVTYVSCSFCIIYTQKKCRFLKGLYKNGGFKHSVDATNPDLRSTYQAVFLLKQLQQWDAFAGKNRKETEDQIKAFLLSHKVFFFFFFFGFLKIFTRFFDLLL
jgi:hypothetical protein